MIRSLLLFALIIHTISAQTATPRAPAQKWLTLSGKAPVVVARGGFSGQFPYGTLISVDNMMTTTMNGLVILYCDLQLSSDNAGFCQPSITLDETTSIMRDYPDGKKTYTINGKTMTGWFTPDFSGSEILNLSAIQNVMSRSSAFDSERMSELGSIITIRNITYLWINIQYEEFYKEKDLSPVTFVEEFAKVYPLSYVSSPEIGMLKALKLGKRTKKVLQVLGKKEMEASTKKTYGEILNDLEGIKEFASGIVVAKEYIWPVKTNNYLDAPTTLVTDAHNAGLEVYASLFANDKIPSLNYSMDPILEYLQFMDNSLFSVDGFISDFMPTAEEATICYAHNSNAPKSRVAHTLVVSHNGASGVYPGSTDLAYEQAIADGADIIDCSVQMTRDKVAFCMDSPDLTGSTTAIPTFMSRSATVPDIQPKSGIFSFDLYWPEILTLKPQIFSPYGYQGSVFQRNPQNKNRGKFLTLVDFIQLAKTKGAPGILISIENAPFLAKKRGLDVIGAVKSALQNETLLDKDSTLGVTIMSSDTQVLSRFEDSPKYQRLFKLEEVIESVPKSTTEEVKKYANGMVVRRHSVLPTSETEFFLTHETQVVNDLHSANLSVYVFYLRNEYVALAFDYSSDPTRELATMIAGYGVDGVITDFPATAVRYLKNKCFDIQQEPAIIPIRPGELAVYSLGVEAPVSAPGPALEVADVVDPPLPPVNAEAAISSPPPPATTTTTTTAVAPAAAKRSPASANLPNLGLSLMLLLLLRFLFNLMDY